MSENAQQKPPQAQDSVGSRQEPQPAVCRGHGLAPALTGCKTQGNPSSLSLCVPICKMGAATSSTPELLPSRSASHRHQLSAVAASDLEPARGLLTASPRTRRSPEVWYLGS